MKHKFTIEEINLVIIFMEEGTVSDIGSRTKFIKGIGDAMKHGILCK